MIVRSAMNVAARQLLASGVVSLALFSAACGGGTDIPPQSPKGAPVTNAKGQDVGASGGRSDISAAAKSTYERAFRSWQEGDLAAAKQGFTEAAQQDPKASSPHYSLGSVLERLGDTAGAQQEYRTAFSLKPDDEVAMGAYALSLASSGHPGEAETFLKDKRQKFPNSARLTNYLAEVKSIAKDSGAAQELAQDALRLDTSFVEAMVTIARDHYRSRRMDLASYALQAILEGFGDATPPRDKENPEAKLLRGLIAKENGRRVAAMTDFEAVRSKRPDAYEATLNLGVMKLEAGNAKEAQPLLETSAKYAPNDAIVRLNLGDCYRLLGETGRAKAELEKSLSLDSSLSNAHYNLGLLYLFSQKVEALRAEDQVAQAIRELETFKTMRGGKVTPGSGGEDIDELINRAKAKQAEMKNASAAAAGATAPATPAGTAPAAGAPPASAPPAGKK
jgi:Tfp pilus assembly protein PilF